MFSQKFVNVQLKGRSNRIVMLNALQYRIFPGPVMDAQRNKVREVINLSDSTHFLVLFRERDEKQFYRGLYSWDQRSSTVYRIGY